MLEAILEGQRVFASQLNDFGGKLDAVAAKVDELTAKYNELSAKQDTLAGLIRDLTREVRDGFDDSNRKIGVLNSRMLTFETWLTRIDERLHEEIVARTR
jgi:outer membrane murein-binding lipoprotein Lpp